MDKRILKQLTNLKILFPSWDYKIFSYYDCSLWECIKFYFNLNDEKFDTLNWIYEFLNWINPITKNDFKLILEGYSIADLFSKILNTRFKWFFGKKKDDEKKDENFIDKNDIVQPYSAYILQISEILKCEVSKVYEYTPSQIEFYIEWKIWNNNDMTEEWKMKNIIKWWLWSFNDLEKDKKDAKEIKDLIASWKVKL